MGYPTKVQLIKRKDGPDQWYINFPTAVAEAMDFTKGEVVNWHVEDRSLLALSRQTPPAPVLKKNRAAYCASSKLSREKQTRPAGSKESGKEA